jgi:methyl-accepting chemotaxis protein
LKEEIKMNLKNLKIGTRLGLGFAAMLFLMAVIAATGLMHLANVGKATDEMIQHALVKERLANQWSNLLGPTIVRSFAMVKATDPTVVAYFAKARADSSALINPVQKQIEEMLSTPEEKKLYAGVADARAIVLDVIEKINKLKAAGQADEATAMADNQFAAGLVVYEDAVAKLAAHQREKIDVLSKGISADHAAGQATLLVLSAIALVLGALFAWRLTVGIVRPLGRAVSVAETVAAGDLSAEIVVESRDEAGQLMLALREMNTSLAKVVGERAHAARTTIATASGQIASGNQDLSSRTEAAGQLAGSKRLRRWKNSPVHREAERGQRAPGQPAGRVGFGSGRARW